MLVEKKIMASNETPVECLTRIKKYSEDVESFLDGSQKIIDNLIGSTKILADYSKEFRTRPLHVLHHHGEKSSLLEVDTGPNMLHVKGFDSEQIWQGIEITNVPILGLLDSKVEKFCNNRNLSLVLDKKIDDNIAKWEEAKPNYSKMQEDIDEEPLSDTVEEDNGSPLAGSEDGEIKSKEIGSSKRMKKSKVDDRFFVLEDMNRFLDSEDKKEMKKVDEEDDDDDDSEDINYFAEDLSEQESSDEFEKVVRSTSKSVGRTKTQDKERERNARMMMYDDFFDQPLSQEVTVSKNPIRTSMEKIKQNIDEDSLVDDVEDENDDDNSYDDDGIEDDIEQEENMSDEDSLLQDDMDDEDFSDDGTPKDDDSENEEDDKLIDDEEHSDLWAEGGQENSDNLMENIHSNDKEVPASRFEKEAKKIKERIKALEEENVAQKPWQLIGEASAAKRPKNSLLAEDLEFEQTLVGAPTITEEVTETIEDTIKQRIKDQAWDDVVRKVKPVEKPFEYKKSLGLDQEKSKLSLAEVYEKEYIKQTQDVKEDESNPDHEVIQKMMDKLFAKLDALSNFQYTPRQPKPELKIVSNLPSVEIEEYTPVTVSTETMLAPEEIYDKKKNEVKGRDEKTTTDRKRERREKKARKREIMKKKEKRLKDAEKRKPGMASAESKKAALETLKKKSRNTKIVNDENDVKNTLKSSSAFFTQLQENVEKQIDKQRNKNVKRRERIEKGEKYKL